MRADFNKPEELWLLMDPDDDYSGLCNHLADLMRKAVNVVGVPAHIGYIFGSTDSDCYSTNSGDWQTRICATHGEEELWLHFTDFGPWNLYQAVCEVVNEAEVSRYYAIKSSLTNKDSPLEILRELITNNSQQNHQAWIYFDQSGKPTPCVDPGPYPVPKP